MLNFDKYEFSCSALGKIYSAKGELTVANKTYLRELYTERKEGKRKEITSKYFEKGHFMEEDGVSMINQVLHPRSLLVKNKEQKSNGWIRGTCDTMFEDIIYDVKNAWDAFTFAKADLTDEYEQQGRGYLWLWEKEIFRLFYCLNNMPEHLLIEEERKMFYRHNFISTEDPEYLKLCEELRAFHNYDDRLIEQRFKVWEIKHDEKEIEKLKAKIVKCRTYLNQLAQEDQEMLLNNLILMGLEPSIILAEHDTELNATIIS